MMSKKIVWIILIGFFVLFGSAYFVLAVIPQTVSRPTTSAPPSPARTSVGNAPTPPAVPPEFVRNTPPATPILSSPTNLATNIALNPAPALSWNSVSGASSYNLYIYHNFTLLGITLFTITDFNNSVINNSVSVSGLSNSRSYYWKVQAVNNVGSSNWSMTWSFTTAAAAPPPANPPAAPSNLSATAVSGTEIDLNWQDNSDNESSFEIWRQGGSAVPALKEPPILLATIIAGAQAQSKMLLATAAQFSLLATVGANIISYQDTGLTSGTSYSYEVRACNAAGCSNYSNIASATTQSTTKAPTQGTTKLK